MSQPVMHLVFTVLETWEQCLASWKQLCEVKELQNHSLPPLGSILADGRNKITDKYNTLADRLGKKFAEGDDISRHELTAVAELVLVKLQTSITQATNLSEAERTAQSALEKTLRALDGLASRLGYNPAPPSRSRSSPNSSKNCSDEAEIRYCDGALLMQTSNASFSDVVNSSNSPNSYTCKYCYLEISNFQVKASSYGEEDWSLLTSCHVVACASFSDRRAGFRCPACDARGKKTVEPSAGTMRVHLDTCTEEVTENKTFGPSQDPRNLPTYHPLQPLDTRAQTQPLDPISPARSPQSSRRTSSHPASGVDTPDAVDQAYEATAPLPTRPAPDTIPLAPRYAPPAPPTQGSSMNGHQYPTPGRRIPGQFPSNDYSIPSSPTATRRPIGAPTTLPSNHLPVVGVISPISGPRSSSLLGNLDAEAMKRHLQQLEQQQQPPPPPQQQQRQQQYQHHSVPQPRPRIPDVSSLYLFEDSTATQTRSNGSGAVSATEGKAVNIRRLVEMGIQPSEAKRVLTVSGGDLEAAVNRAMNEGLIKSGI